MYYKGIHKFLLGLSIAIPIVAVVSLMFILNVEGSEESPRTALVKKRVEVMADNHNITVDTHAETVGEVLKQLKISIGDQDVVEPSPITKLSGQGQIRVTRISENENEVIEDIPYVTVTYNDPGLYVGTEEVIQEGKTGKELVRRSLRVENGVSVTENVINRKVVTPYIPRVVAVGTATPVVDPYPNVEGQFEAPAVLNYTQPTAPKVVTIEARPVNYKFMLDNVELTAYTAGFESTGKNPDDPGYGVTASGAEVFEGRTIAVDPTVIPLGWWVYIQGVGYRKAEDTGSAIKGKIIDVYIEDISKAKKFGRKYGNTVYVIGPEKPQ